MKRKQIAIVGSGPAALALACMLDQEKYEIDIYEKQFAPARKFLVAGDGGFNLTHGEDIEAMIPRYTPDWFLKTCLREFTNNDLRNWLKTIGIETFIGSSKRVFPVKPTKPIEVLNAILKLLKSKNIPIHTQYQWTGWTAQNELQFYHNHSEIIYQPDITVFALGGGSWKKTGSDGNWLQIFDQKGIPTRAFEASNCAYNVNWPSQIRDQLKGKWLKNIEVRCGHQAKKGELVIKEDGLEGGAIYALSPQIREELHHKGFSLIYIDFKPDLKEEEILSRLHSESHLPVTQKLKKLIHLSTEQIVMLKSYLNKEHYQSSTLLASAIKNFEIRITATGDIDQAISTVGGVLLDAVDNHFQLVSMPNQYVLGEMLDWDAPTGGYLLQASFSMGVYLAKHLNIFY